ncbi:MAG: hypothetical protein ACYS8Z_05685, partial [Planctomycetota bacterium]
MYDRLNISIWGVLIFALACVSLPGGFAVENVRAEAGECQGASNPDPPDGSTFSNSYWEYYCILDYTACEGAASYTGYFSDNKADVDYRDPAHCLGSPPRPNFSETAFWVGDYDPCVPEFARNPLVIGTTYYWCADFWVGEQYWPGPTWSFTLISYQAWGPSPADGEQWVPNDGTMTWNLGAIDPTGFALSYDVYIGRG